MSRFGSLGWALLCCCVSLHTPWAAPTVASDLRVCAPPPHMTWEFEPVHKLQGAESYGSDRSAEPFVLAIMQADAAWRGSADRAVADGAIKALARWADADALEDIEEVGEDRSNTNSIYSLRRALIPLLAAWADLAAVAPQPERDKVDHWLDRLMQLEDTDTGGRKGRGGPGAVSNRNNHAYMRATVDALWAVAAHDKGRAAKAADVVRSALAGMRPDGSLPLETARGARALWYQRHALASLVYIADLLQPLGYDLWAPRPDGHSLHDAVAFLAAASVDPSLVAPYAAADRNPKPGTDPSTQDLGFLEPRPHGRHYMAWFELYRARFPDSDITTRMARLIRPSLEAARPLIDELVGGNTSCRVVTGRRS